MMSLERQLILWLVGLFSIMGLLAGAVSFYFALDQASGMLDHQLKQIAISVDDGDRLSAMQVKYREESPVERAQDFVIQTWVGGKPARSSRPGFDLPRSVKTGFSELALHDSKWRAYSIVYQDRTVQVSQANEVRFEIALESALRVLFPSILLIPLSWLLVRKVVHRALQPLQRTTEEAMRRDATSFDALPVERVPMEVVPLIQAMNDLISRLGTAFQQQRKFLSDAAHELRTPIAALQLQIDNLSPNRSREELEIRIDEMKRGSLRASHLVNQLLHMARYEVQSAPAVRSEVLLRSLVEACVADFIPFANSRGIDLGITRNDAAVFSGNGDDIRILIGNLIDNAVRYTPTGGKVDIDSIVSDQYVVINVVDTGPGIPESALPRVFDRFFRAAGQEMEGSGIGLAIVKAIAERESIKVTLTNRQDQRGLNAKVEIAFDT